jgi:transaldolase
MIDSTANLTIKLFADGADFQSMVAMNEDPQIRGFTTNPTLMRKAGIRDYRQFALGVVDRIQAKPISFEVFADDLEEMKRQALEIATWGENVYVKIPITTTLGESTAPVIDFLVSKDIKVNVTAIMTIDQVATVVNVLDPRVPSCISVFAGRVADTGRDPIPTMVKALELMKGNPSSELIWASPRELLNVFQANEIGCHIITATSDILAKLPLVGYNLIDYSLDTVKMFRRDTLESGFSL